MTDSQKPPASPAQHVMDAEDAAVLQAIQLSLSLDAESSAASVATGESSASATALETTEVTEKAKTKKDKKKKKKKKKKKNSYKNFLKSVMSPTKNSSEIRASHKETLRKNLGGGAFDKVQKI